MSRAPRTLRAVTFEDTSRLRIVGRDAAEREGGSVPTSARLAE